MHHGGYVVLVTTAAQMVVAMSNIVLSTIAPKVAESLGVAPVLVGYHVGITFGAAAVASVYGGIVVLRVGAARTTQISMVSTVIGLALLALPHVGFIALGSLFVGTGMGFAAPAASYLLVRHTSSERRNLLFSIKQTGVPLGGVVIALAAPAPAGTASTGPRAACEVRRSEGCRWCGGSGDCAGSRSPRCSSPASSASC